MLKRQSPTFCPTLFIDSYPTLKLTPPSDLLHHVCESVFVVKPHTLQRPGSDVTARVTGSPSLISLYYKVRGQGRLPRPRGRARTRLLKHACLHV